MTPPLRVAFFGSPGFAVPVLDAVREHFQVVLVVTQPDKPVGRGLRLTPPPLAAHAGGLGLPLAQPSRLRGPAGAGFAELLRETGADVAVTCAYGKILPAELLDVPRHGFLNTHTSLLPRYRGAAPIQWALIRGETLSGTTIMQTDPGMDTGPILLQQEQPILPHWTARELGSALQAQAAGLIVQALSRLGELVPRPQDEAGASHAPPLQKADGQLRWTDPAASVYNRYRGVVLWPQTSATLNGQRLKVLEMRPLAGDREGAPGEVLGPTAGGLSVACGEGSVELRTVQPESRRPMPAADWWRGLGLRPGARFGHPEMPL